MIEGGRGKRKKKNACVCGGGSYGQWTRLRYPAITSTDIEEKNINTVAFVSALRYHGSPGGSDGDACPQELSYTAGGSQELSPIASEEVFMFTD